ncbi:MAG: hypothetical protein ACTSRG_05485 [Candidatus Helarchaeota archaeon]
MGFPLFDYFAENAHIILALGGLFAGFWFIDWIIRRPEAEEERPAYLIAIDCVGFFIGIISLGAGITLLLGGGQNFFAQYFWWLFGGRHDAFTMGLIVAVGLCLFLKPIKDIPWASLMGLIAGAAVVFLSITYLETYLTWIANLLGIDIKILYGVIFILIFGIIFSLFGLAQHILHLVGTILGSKPGSFVIMLLCFIQAIMISLPPHPDSYSLGVLFGIV